jgi:hypothetical protein
VRSKRQLLFAVLIVGFVWASLRGHWLPMPIQSTLFIIVLFLELGMIVAGWWCWNKARSAENVARWRKTVGLVGIAANTTALAVPIGSLLYMMYYPFIASLP